MSDMSLPALSIEQRLQRSREASYGMGVLTTEQKNTTLACLAELMAAQADFLLTENRRDCQAQEGKLPPALYQRLGLDRGKLAQLVQGIQDVARLPDPVGRILSRTKLDDGLVLEKKSVPLGVIAVVFESRPDVLPQILALALKSGNAAVLKGGQEDNRSNQAMMTLVQRLNAACPWLPTNWAILLDSRQAVQEMLGYPQYVDLVIPRGSNQLVQSISAETQIPVLGHAEGVCHLYVHEAADLNRAIPVVIDAKAQYPAACNALETLLVDRSIATVFLKPFEKASVKVGIVLKGCPETVRILPGVEPASEIDWRTEYGDPTLSVRVISGVEEAIDHINRYGSHHTDGILTRDSDVRERFLAAVDSACVFANASTRFADGFRFGLGAEIGISTARTHARGPVGLEGLVIYKYILRGDYQQVSTYVGEGARPLRHEEMD